jgi:N-acetylglucosaminyl-diphospho-decaprenol L-rhamnosyltransferase
MTKTPTTVEIQLVTFNGRDCVRQTLRSVHDSIGTDNGISTTIAVLDNASDDDCADMVAAEFPSVRLIRQPTNILYGPASNILIETTAADYVLVLNPDTLVLDDIVAPLLGAFQAHPDISIAYPRLVDSAGATQPVGQRFPTLAFELAVLLRGTRVATTVQRWWNAHRVVEDFRFPSVISDEPYAFDFVTSTCMLMRTDVALRYGPFESDLPMYDCDLDLSRRMSADGCTAVFVSGCTVVHVGGASSTSKWKQSMSQAGRKRYYDKHHGRVTGAVFAGLNGTVTGIKKVRHYAA